MNHTRVRFILNYTLARKARGYTVAASDARLSFSFELPAQFSTAMVTANKDMAHAPAIGGGFVVSRLDAVINWIRANSIWPMPMGVACCAIELMAAGGARFDIARFGAEVMRFSPRQSDCMIVAGTVTYKMAPHVRRIYDQMAAPKWVIAMGACACTGGMYRNYAVLQGIDRILPVDVYVSGCPPRPEAVLDALVKMQDKIRREPSAKMLLKKPESPKPEG